MKKNLIGTGLALGALSLSTIASAGFNFDGNCTGAGDFVQDIQRNAIVSVGTIPRGTDNLRVDLVSPGDVDIQLVDKSNGHLVVAWPNGDLNGPTRACEDYAGARICYSGYNGVDGKLGTEYIEVTGAADVDLEMRAFGYAAGNAQVNYKWNPKNTCNEAGSGSFEQNIPYRRSSVVGTIPRGTASLVIELKSGSDVDVQLVDTDNNVNIIAWAPRAADMGLLNGPTYACTEYEGAEYCYSGYNGIDGQLGWEKIWLNGVASNNLEMRAYGYQSGDAVVNYEWSVGAGAICGSRGLKPCNAGLTCKNGDHGNIAVDRPGQCHTDNWCESDASAIKDCANLFHIAVPGHWSCEQYECKYNTTPVGPGIGELGGMCGGIAGFPCNDGLECQITETYPDAAGVCVEPVICPAVFEPVCGMNGQTYSNTCRAHAAGQAVLHSGECTGGSPAGGACGESSSVQCEENLHCNGEKCCPPANAFCDAYCEGTPAPPTLSGCAIPMCQCEETPVCPDVSNYCELACNNQPLPEIPNGCPVPGCACPEEPEVLCAAVYDPVCGMNGTTYSNECEAGKADAAIAHKGVCVEGASSVGGACDAASGLSCEEGLYCAAGTVCCAPGASICDAICNGTAVPPTAPGCPQPGCACPPEVTEVDAP